LRVCHVVFHSGCTIILHPSSELEVDLEGGWWVAGARTGTPQQVWRERCSLNTEDGAGGRQVAGDIWFVVDLFALIFFLRQGLVV
jgi:hypothetical protein